MTSHAGSRSTRTVADPAIDPALCLHELFARRATATPDRVAVTDPGSQLTYEELEGRANQLARRLRALGAATETLVGLHVERCTDLLVGLLGILKAGSAYVPLDPRQPRERLTDIRAETGLDLVVCGQDLAADAAALGATAVPVTTAAAASPPDTATGPGNAAYVLYTSGSTGAPNGVIVTHHNVTRLFASTAAWFHFGPRDVWTLFHSTAFDFSVFEIWGALLHGGRLVVVDTPSARDPVTFLQLMRRHGVTVLCQTPSAFYQLAPVAIAADDDLPLRLVIFGGEALDFAALRPWVNRYGDRRPRLVNMYGITETTVHATYRPISAADVVAPPGSCLGVPLPDLTLHLLDPTGKPAATGQIGEIHVGGAGLARGYLRRPALEAARFVPDPFTAEPGRRLYRSGDLARRLPDGDLEFVGRRDDQVQVRGFRVELGEVAAVLRRLGGVRDAAVVARETASGGTSLVAYVVSAARALATESLRAHAREHLPDYMRPGAYVLLDALPLTSNGKLDRGALPPPTRRRPELETPYREPRSPTESALASLWAELLELDRVGRDDDFFELGGHSLLATGMAARANRALGVEIPPSAVFETPTIAGLAAVADAVPDSGDTGLAGRERLADAGGIPLTPAQERVWFLERLHPHGRAYHSQATFTFRGPLDVAALEGALDDIVRRHESYRTSFPCVNGRPVQRVHEPWRVRLGVVSLEDDGKALRHAIATELERPIDLERLPIVRWTLFSTGPQEHVLLHAEQHLVHDGWSFNVFARELAELYASRVAGEPKHLPGPQLQLADVALEQQRWLEGPESRRQAAYWRERLADAPPVIALPAERPRPPRPSYRGEAPRQVLPAELCRQLRALSRASGTTLFMTMLAGFVALLYRHSGQGDLCVGTGVANRQVPGSETVLGMILNNLVLRCDLSGNPSFRELLARVRATCLEAYAHQYLPFDRVVEAAGPRRDPSRNPLFQVAFSFHDAPLPELRFPELDVEVDEAVSNGSAKFDLNVIAIPEREQRTGSPSGPGVDSVRLIWEFATDLFDTVTIERMMERYARLLAAGAADPTLSVDELPLTSDDEEALLAAWNRTGTPYPRDEPVHRLFHRQAKRDPDAVALESGDRMLSYGELQARSLRLASRLRERGVGDGRPVALLLERSFEAVAGILAILQAGGAYMPLDPEEPPERLATILRDSGTRVVLTSEDLRSRLPEFEAEILLVDRAEEDDSGDALPAGEPRANTNACVMYTSGSTGEPKGVCVPHRAIVRLVTGLDGVRLGTGETLLQMAPLAFDASTFEIWGALATGGRLVLFPGRAGTPTEIGEVIQRHDVTTLWLTAPLFRRVVDEALDALVGVRQLLTGGDVVPPGHVRRALRAHPHLTVIDGYGPTEATTFTCCHVMRAPEEVSEPVPIGRPLRNTRVWVLDGARRPVGPGIVGELWIGGDGLALGYLGRPKETAARFVPDPFSARPGDRLYRSGDLARWRTDGSLEFLGRVDRQVKVRGHRVEPGEIEMVLERHPAIAAAAVRAWPDGDAELRLAAYVVVRRGARASDRELRTFLLTRLPRPLVPAAFVPLDALPLDGRGKIDHGELPEPPAGTSPRAGSHTAPRTPTERAVADVWGEVLGIHEIGAGDDFFELGGHSLLAMQVAARIEERLGVRLPLRCLFETPTLAQLAAVIDSDNNPSGNELGPIVRQPRTAAGRNEAEES